MNDNKDRKTSCYDSNIKTNFLEYLWVLCIIKMILNYIRKWQNEG